MSKISLQALDRSRATVLGNLTKTCNAVKSFDVSKDSINVLRAFQRKLDIYEDRHREIINDMFQHENLDNDKIDENMDKFDTQLCDVRCEIEDKLKAIEIGTKDIPWTEFQQASEAVYAIQSDVLACENFKLSYDADAVSLIALSTRRDILRPKMGQFDDSYAVALAHATAEERTELKKLRDSISTKYVSLMTWLAEELKNRTPSNSSEAAILSNLHGERREVKVKLAPIELPKHDGQPKNWVPFRDSFKAFIHESTQYPNVEKFRRLKSCITDPLSPISHLVESNDGYAAAWQAVLAYYDDKRIILDNHITALLLQKRMATESHDELQKIINNFTLQTAGMEAMFEKAQLYDAIVAHLALFRLDSHSRDLFETDNKNEIPFWPKLQTFLQERRKTLSALPPVKVTSKPNSDSARSTKPPQRSASAHVSDVKPSKQQSSDICALCQGNHRLRTCPQFLLMPIPKRQEKVTALKLCNNCLGAHSVDSCQSKFNCQSCQQRHNTMLHAESGANNFRNKNSSSTTQHSSGSRPASGSQPAAPSQLPTSQMNPNAQIYRFNSHASFSAHRSSFVLMSTALVLLQDAFGDWHEVRALLDSGSNANFVTRNVAKALKIPMHRTCVEVHGIAKTPIIIDEFISTIVSSRVKEHSTEFEFLVLDKITNQLPMQRIDTSTWSFPDDVVLADPFFNTPGKIDILIGNEMFLDLIEAGKARIANGPTLRDTIYGWIVGGRTQSTSRINAVQCNFTNVNEIRESVEKFYKLEDYRNEKRFLTDEEQFCESVFEQTHQRAPDGRFIVTIPLKTNVDQLANNRRQAMCQYIANEKRLQKNDRLKCEYDKFMNEYLELGHMTEVDVSGEADDAPAYYLPHHAVEKPDSSTTKVRVVFNASSKTSSGLSFNDVQCIGPTVQTDSFDLMLKFRQHEIAFKADIAKMYRQVQVVPHQRHLQRIIWNNKTYELNTVTYGTSSASFQSTRCLKQLAIEFRERYPRASREVEHGFYVDDLLSGADSVDDAVNLFAEINTIVSSGAMKLRKINSNSLDFLQSIPEDDREEVEADMHIKALGIKWTPSTDSIGFDVKPIEARKLTKRIVYSEVCKIYDPEGLLGPVTFRFKLFMKRVWNANVNWDDPLPQDIADEWMEIAQTMYLLNTIRIDRCMKLHDAVVLELHGFADASNLGYGACIFVVSESSHGKRISRLICAKSRIAPTEYVSTARLELCGALILIILIVRVMKALDVTFSKVICWLDSAIAIWWIKKPPSSLQQFVANRVNEIQQKSQAVIWKHIRGELNPADLISRGLSPSELISNDSWWHGPEFLLQPEAEWPISIVEIEPTEVFYTSEFKKIHLLAASVEENRFLRQIEDSSRSFAVKFKLAPLMRFIFNCRAKKNQQSRRVGRISSADLHDAEIAMARICQATYLKLEMDLLRDSKSLPKRSPIRKFDPFFDKQIQVVRVGGRLKHSNLDFNHKHPILLPKCHLAEVIARETHQLNLHSGQRATLSFIMQRYWILHGKSIVRKEVQLCIKCVRARPQLVQQKMGDLPAERVTIAATFDEDGVDYAGPFTIKLSSVRNAKLGKAYIALFVCFATKATHLEVVSDLTTKAFLAALDRFISRRSRPSNIYSDNGTNFVGAKNELNDLYEFLKKHETQQEIIEHLRRQEIDWHFIPPRAPTFGGLWEAAVKSMKHHLTRIVGNAALTFEELATVAAKIESILNSRPLTPLSGDPNDLEALTPGHFLVHRPLNAKPERDFTTTPTNRLQRWDRITQINQHFWKRWSDEYLTELQTRNKNAHDVIPIEVGQLVVIKNEDVAPLAWPLGRIASINPGKDGATRVAQVKTAKGIIPRPLNKLVLLPIERDVQTLPPGEC
jgi:hypothetical protein